MNSKRLLPAAFVWLIWGLLASFIWPAASKPSGASDALEWLFEKNKWRSSASFAPIRRKCFIVISKKSMDGKTPPAKGWRNGAGNN